MGSLFRDNSIGNKLFVAYSKIVGLQYLWDVLALPVNEVIFKHRKQEEAKENVSEMKSIMSASLEV